MTFKDAEFWAALVMLYGVSHLLPQRLLAYALCAFSLVFYGSLNPAYLVPLLLCVAWDYGLARAIERAAGGRRRGLVVLSVSANLGLLIFYKYTGRTEFPIGVSFYTFQSISYVVDVYRRRLPAEKDFTRFLLYVSFFPQLITGPIERGRALIPQLRKLRPLPPDQLTRPAYFILWGLVKCVLFSDQLGALLAPLRSSGPLDLATQFLIGVATTVKVYADFSGYSEIAQGLAMLFGVRLMTNFRPFLGARSPAEFWRAWHLSLTAWVRDYLLPLLVPRGSAGPRVASGVLLSFVLIGIWHGASLNWFLFGAFHGLAFLGHRELKKRAPRPWPVPLAYCGMLSFYAVCGFLHAHPSGTGISQALQAALRVPVQVREAALLALLLLGFVLPLVAYEKWLDPSLRSREDWPLRARDLLLVAGLLVLVLLFNHSGTSFEYYQF